MSKKSTSGFTIWIKSQACFQFTALVNALVKISAHVLHTPAGLLSSYTLHVAMPPTREVYVLTNASSDSSPFSPHGSLLGCLHEAAMVVAGEKELAIN